MKENSKNYILAKTALIGLTILILLKLVIYQNFLIGREVYFQSDDAIYATLAKRFLAGDFWHGFHPYWSPGFSLSTIPFYIISKSWETSQFLVSIFSAVLLMVLLFWFYKRYSYILAFIIAFIFTFSLSFQFLITGLGIATEPLYILLLWSGIFFGWLAIAHSQIRFYVLTGIFFGLAYLTRTETIIFFTLFVIISGLTFVLKKRAKINIFNRATTMFLAAALVAHFYFPLIKFTKLTTVDFNVFNSPLGFVFSLPLLTFGFLMIPFEIKKIGYLNILKRISPKISILLITFLVINLPYIVFISIDLGRPTLSGKYAFLGTGPYYNLEEDRMTTLAQDIWSTDYIDYSSPYFNPKRANTFIIKNFENGILPEYAVKSFLESIQLYKSENTSSFFVGLGLYFTFAGFAFGILFSKFRRLTLYLTLLWLTGLLWVSFFMGPHYRYLVFALPFFFYLQGLAIYGSGRLTFFVARLFCVPRIAKLLAIILPIFFIADYYVRNVEAKIFTSVQHTGKYKDHKILGEWIKSQNIKVMGGRVEAIPFYADAKLVYMPSSPPNEIVSYMKAWGVEYLLVRPQEVGYDFVAPIANPEFRHPDLKLFKRFNKGTLIWRVKLTDKEKKNNLRLIREKKL